METENSADAAFLEHTLHYITKARNSSKTEDCISLPKGVIVNMASGSRFLKPAEKPDAGKKTPHPKMTACLGPGNDEVSTSAQACSTQRNPGASAHARARELLCRRKIIAKPESFDKSGKPRDMTRSAKTLLQPYMLPHAFKAHDDKSVLQLGRPGTRSMVSISNPATPTRTTPPVIGQIGTRKLSSKSDLALSAQQKTKIKGLESLKAAGMENAESQEAKNRRIIQWLQGLPDVHSHGRPGFNSPKCDTSRLYHAEARQVSSVRPATGRCNRSTQKASHVPCTSNTFQSHSQEPQAKRPAKTAPELVEAATGSRSLHWLKSTGFNKLQHCSVQGDLSTLEEVNHQVSKADVTKRKSASPCQKPKFDCEAHLETSLQKAVDVWRIRDQNYPLPMMVSSAFGKTAKRRENSYPLVASSQLPPLSEEHLGMRLSPLVDLRKMESKSKILNDISQLVGSGLKSECPLKSCKMLASPQKSSRHPISNAIQAGMEPRLLGHEKRRKVCPEGSDSNDGRKNEAFRVSKSNTALLRRHFLLWRKFVTLRAFKTSRAENFARNRLLRCYFLTWRQTVQDKQMLRYSRTLNYNKCTSEWVDAYYSLHLLEKLFHHWKWWTRWHQKRASYERRDFEITKKIESYFLLQQPKHTTSDSHDIVMEVPPCMSSSTHLIMDALTEVCHQGYFDEQDNLLPSLKLLQPTVKTNDSLEKTSCTVIKSCKSFRVTTSKIEKSPRGKRPRSLQCAMAVHENASSGSSIIKLKWKKRSDTKGQQMVQAMELRAVERKKRLAVLKERKKNAAEDRLAFELKLKEDELQMEKAEKRRQREEYKEKIRANEQQAAEKLKRLKLDEEQRKLARQHYKHYLLQYGMRRWKAYMADRSYIADLACEHRKRVTLKYGMQLWQRACLKIRTEKESMADSVYQRHLKMSYLSKWKDLLTVQRILEAFADRHVLVKLGKKLFPAWNLWTINQVLLRHSQEKLADNFQNRKLLNKVIRHWTELPKIIEAERIREERLNKLRERVQQLIPDFSPSFDDKLIVSNRSTM